MKVTDYRGTERKMSPADALDEAVMAAFLLSKRRAPGVVIESLSPATREALSRLTSDEALRVRMAR